MCQLFGDINPQEQADQGTASRLWIADATLFIPPAKKAAGKEPENDTDKSDPQPPPTYVRDGVGIDRPSRTAARQGAVKFDLEVLPAGTTFCLRLEWAGDELVAEELLVAALAEWQAGRGAIGGRTNRGVGWLQD